MAVLPISSQANVQEALRQIDMNFRELSAEMNLLKKRVKELETS